MASLWGNPKRLDPYATHAFFAAIVNSDFQSQLLLRH